MHKHLRPVVVTATLIFVVACAGASITKADAAPSWLTAVLNIQKQTDTVSLPTTLGGAGNIDCSTDDLSNCSVPTQYGVATSNSTVRLSSSNIFLPVLTNLESRQRFFPVPNSNEAISFFSGPPIGLNVAFNYNLSSSLGLSGSGLKINKLPDAKLADKAKHLLAADSASISFSENGRWLVVSAPNVAILRVNLQTFEVLPFAAGFNYSIGLDPSVKTAITNDGRFAVVASKNFSVFKLYDLNTCAPVPDTINAAVSCQSRDLGSFMQQAVPGYSFTNNVRFLNNDSLSLFATYQVAQVNKTARFILGNSGGVSQLDYLALGDSYIVGEGAFDYMSGTDTSTNKCHLSFLSYPTLIGLDLNYNSYHNVACSGAVVDDIINTGPDYKGQADNKQISRTQRDDGGQTALYINTFMPGYIDQLDFVKTYQPKVITVSVGGNDMGFADILKTCVIPSPSNNTCYSTYEDRLELVRQINKVVYPRLVQAYQKLKTAGPPDMRIYVIGYPQIAKPGGDCGLNVHLNSDEILFSQELISYLDSVIKIAAAKTGVYYVDTQDALDGHRLCEAGPGSIAMNGLTAGNDRPSRLGGPIADESYHPNAFGYQLLESKILAESHNLTNPMPLVDLSASLPAESNLMILNIDKSGRSVSTIQFDTGIAPDLGLRQDQIPVAIVGANHNLGAGTTLRAELHSTPTSLGNFTTDNGGNLTTLLTIPAEADTGYHTLHFYGTDFTGQPVDIYKNIYIGASADDLDGNGLSDLSQRCIGLSPSGQDFDKDGIDDTCDANITQPPIQLPPTSNDSQKPLGSSGSTGGGQSTIEQSSTVDDTSQAGQVLSLESSVNPIATGIDTSNILTISPDVIVAATPSVLGASTSKPSPAIYADSSGDRTPINPGYLIIGLLIMLVAMGLAFKRVIM